MIVVTCQIQLHQLIFHQSLIICLSTVIQNKGYHNHHLTWSAIPIIIKSVIPIIIKSAIPIRIEIIANKRTCLLYVILYLLQI